MKNLRPIQRIFRDCLVLLFIACLGALNAPAQQPATEATEYLHAQHLIQQHQWREGLAILSRLIQSNPQNPRILNLIGLGLIGNKEPESAIPYFQKAIKIDPRFVPGMKNLAIDEFDLGQPKAAEQLLQSASVYSPNDPVIHLYLGEIAYSEHHFKAAAANLGKTGRLLYANSNTLAALVASDSNVGHIDEALRLLRDLRAQDITPDFQLAVASALTNAGHPADALPYFAALRSEYPHNHDVIYDVALCYIRAKEFGHAINSIQQWIQQNHETADLDSLLGQSYEAQKQTKSAIDAYRRAIRIAPNHVEYYLDFASLCSDHQDYNAGLKVIEVGLKNNPESSRLYFEQGALYAMQNNYGQAEKSFDTSAKLAPAAQSSYIGLGITFLETGNTKKAIHILHERLAKNPNNPTLLYLLGESLMRSGAAPGGVRFAEAQKVLEKSVALNPNFAVSHVALGKIYLSENKVKDAAKQFSAAVKLDPMNNSAYAHLVVAYRRLGDKQKERETIDALKRVLMRKNGPSG